MTEIAEAEGIGRALASRQANPPIIQRASGGQASAFSGSPTHRAQYREAARTGRDSPSNCAAHLDWGRLHPPDVLCAKNSLSFAR
ncbi:MAG TPA: hypothetical protein VEX68_09905 [Bryobacteraceae bacterium]|nr:hypothetical protein [Bryobacteraceae bacterium]